jgi:hypothetical protein
MSGIVGEAGARSDIIQPRRPYPNAGVLSTNNTRTFNFDRPGDGHYDVDPYTSILIRSDSTNNSLYFSDYGFYRHTITRSGSLKHDTGLYKSSLGPTGMNFHGNDSNITMPDHDSFHAGNDWTIDFWFKGTKMYGGQMTGSGNGNPRDTFFLTENSSWGFYGFSTSGNWKETSPGATNDAWHHWALVVHGADYDNPWTVDSGYRRFLMFKDGKILSDQSWNPGGSQNGNLFYLGKFQESNGATSWSNGFLAEFRFSKGIARWKTEFQIW